MGQNTLEKQYLKGHVLLAMPAMVDPRFIRSVIYICSHNEHGAMGLVINRIFGSVMFSDLLDQVGIKTIQPKEDQKVHFGGPMEAGRGFVLHTTDFLQEGSMVIEDGIALTGTLDILQAIAKGEGPRKHMLLLGYAGWTPGQLEEEMQANSWISAPASPELIFDVEVAIKWERALQKMGIDLPSLSAESGHA
ncbi:MAG TPA: YqgE/AlgH family protein [Rhodospirillaceae bacterium]|nr:MAG: hypothetical protein A2018_01595 [Alphaproteobacteria bacterium GWF2_58_20]HAU28537.1 YqgE/AlgH family protein [Rhodospirillaceae bacterium]